MTNQEDNRVLSRRGARLMTETEVTKVSGGIDTETLCSYIPNYGVDGDLYTGDCIAS